MRSIGFAASAAFLAISLACGNQAPPPAAPAGPAVDPATAATITATVKFDGQPPTPEMITLTGDPKCVSENGAPQRPDERIVVGENQALQNVFVYVKDGLGSFAFPIPSEPAVLDQDKCRYSPRVLGVRVGQAIDVVNDDPTMHNVHALPMVNQEFNKSQTVQHSHMLHTFTAPEVMVKFMCNVHQWMASYVGVVAHPYFAVTDESGQFALKNLPPGTYTIEAWHEKFGTQTAKVTIGDKQDQTQAFTFTAAKTDK